jgi:titin
LSGAPDAPTVTDILSESCQVSWQAPAEDGGSPITGYHLERRAAGSSRWIRVNKEQIPELTLNVADLVEGNEYEFRVAAENKAGIGEFSPPSQPFTAKNPWEKPGKPGRPETTDITGYTVHLTWTAPESDGGAEIFNYVIEYRVQGTSKWVKFVAKEHVPETNHTVTGLKEDTYYEFHVAAENKAGQGPYSDPSEVIKTPVGMQNHLQIKEVFLKPILSRQYLFVFRICTYSSQ